MKRINNLLLSFCLLLISGTTHATPFSNLYIFGDSLSDVGNALAASGGSTPNQTYYPSGGRLSNGPIYADTLWTSLGFSGDIAPRLAGGTNYAFAGARSRYGSTDLVVDSGGSGALVPPPVGTAPTAFINNFVTQIDQYLFDVSGNADSDALFVAWTGNNDIRDLAVLSAIGSVSTAQALFNQSVTDVVGSLTDLINAGAQHLLIPTVTNIGLTPEAQASGFASVFSDWSAAYNQAIDQALLGFTGVDISRVDTFDRLGEVVADPAAFGLTNATDPCLSGYFVDAPTSGPINICANQETYAFWDIIHPSNAVHTILANDFRAAVPVPASLPLLLIGLVTLAAMRRRA